MTQANKKYQNIKRKAVRGVTYVTAREFAMKFFAVAGQLLRSRWKNIVFFFFKNTAQWVTHRKVN